MVRALKMRKILPYSGLQNSGSKLEMARVKYQGLSRHMSGSEIYLIVSLHTPAGKFSGSRGEQWDLACF